jgi:hypothetical protein
MAALEAVAFSMEAGFFDVVFEVDALQIVQDVNSSSPNLSRMGHFVELEHKNQVELV